MKAKNGFVLREIADSWILVPIDEQPIKVHEIITLNDTAATIWKCLQNDCSEEKILKKLCFEFDVMEEEAKEEVNDFLAILKEKDMLQ